MSVSRCARPPAKIRHLVNVILDGLLNQTLTALAKPSKLQAIAMSQPDYSWAEYLDYMEGGGSDVVSLPAAKPVVPAPAAKDHPLWGVLVAIGVTLAAIFLAELPFAPFTLAG